MSAALRELGGFAYPLVLAALPRHGDLFSAKRTPVSRLTLERRLALLPAADRAEIDAIEGLLRWSRAQEFADDAAFLAHAETVLARLRTEFVRGLVADRLHLRSVTAALRRRAQNAPAPEKQERFGLTPAAWRIRRNWTTPGFGLGPQDAWAKRVDAAMRAGDPAAVERELMAEAWRRLAKAGEQEPRGYPAIVVYVLRWTLIDRWIAHNEETARARFATWTRAVAGTLAA